MEDLEALREVGFKIQKPGEDVLESRYIIV